MCFEVQRTIISLSQIILPLIWIIYTMKTLQRAIFRKNYLLTQVNNGDENVSHFYQHKIFSLLLFIASLIIFHCSFNLKFWMTNEVEYIFKLIYVHLNILLCEVTVQVFQSIFQLGFLSLLLYRSFNTYCGNKCFVSHVYCKHVTL